MAVAIHRFSITWIIFVSLLSICATNASRLTLEQRVQYLERDYKKMKEKVKILEANVTQLQTQIQQQQNSVDSNQRVHQNTIYRTCHDAFKANSTLSSGIYQIDPDGQHIGDKPINVHCDMKTGMTLIGHDSENVMDVGHCKEPGCYSKNVTYDATMRQISALASLSVECHQTIKYDCINAPLEFNGVAFSWWNDKNGDPQYFWTGSNSGNNASKHMCQCGIDGVCFESSKGIPCNCDSVLQTILTDYGIITNKNLLPITRLNFGRTMSRSSSGKHALGRFECTGRVEVGVPKSCEDLWRLGHIQSGVYLMGNETTIETVYCDFKKIPSDSNFQTVMGFAGVTDNSVVEVVRKLADAQASTIESIKSSLVELNAVVEESKEELSSSIAAAISESKKGFEKALGKVRTTLEARTRRAETIVGMPKSCKDLHRLGHLSSGFYSVMGNKTIETVFCDFKKSESGLEMRIGYVDIKTSIVCFYVQRTSLYKSPRAPIPFDVEKLNFGSGMNLSTGIFTAPRTGVYFFSFTGTGMLGGVKHCFITISLMWNGNSVGHGRTDETRSTKFDSSWDWETISVQSTLILKEGDRIWVQIHNMSTTDVYLFDDPNNHHTHFTGWLLEEDISQSLKSLFAK